MWSRHRDEGGELVHHRLEFQEDGLDNYREMTEVENYNKYISPWTLEERLRFASPRAGTGPGEYNLSKNMKQKGKVIEWARGQAANLQPGDRFPTPKLGTRPGEFASQAELDAAKQAIVWSRMQGQIGEEMHQQLKFMETQAADKN